MTEAQSDRGDQAGSHSETKVLNFPKADTSEEHARRVMAEATRLANLSPGEWRLWIDSSTERLGITRAHLEAAVIDIIRDNEKKRREAEAEQRRQEQRAEKQRTTAKRDEDRREREQRRIEQEAERKTKEKNKAFATMVKLPAAQHETKIAELAKRLDEDFATLRDEFAAFSEAESSVTPSAEWEVEPWAEPVATAALLQELIDKISKHIVVSPHDSLAIALWVVMAWAHEFAATHSTYLVATSAEPDSGKTTLLGVLRFLTPKPFTAAESTGPSVFRFVDREKPTLLVDEADDLFQRKADIKHIFNAAWTRGTKIPRQVSIQGVSVTVWFDPFCPKAVGLLGLNLPATLRGRSVVIKLWPKKPEEKVENFSHTDDEEFTNLRRKCARWAADNAGAIKEAKPVMSAKFNNRAASNWRLLLAIADLAGGNWPNQARDAAERLSLTRKAQSYGVQCLAAFQAIFAGGKKEVTSETVVATLNLDPTGIWIDYNHGGPITQRQVAYLLEPFDIRPVVIHPTKRAGLSRRGYRAEQFKEAFARFLLLVDPNIRTKKQSRKARRKARK
jgi:putative DNA primase/helicase